MVQREDEKQKSHDLEKYKIEKSFNNDLEREITIDLERSFGENDISYAGEHYNLDEEIIEKVIDKTLGKKSHKYEEEPKGILKWFKKKNP